MERYFCTAGDVIHSTDKSQSTESKLGDIWTLDVTNFLLLKFCCVEVTYTIAELKPIN